MANKLFSQIKKATVGFALAGVLAGGLGVATASSASAATTYKPINAISKTTCKYSPKLTNYYYSGATQPDKNYNDFFVSSERGKSVSEKCSTKEVKNAVKFSSAIIKEYKNKISAAKKSKKPYASLSTTLAKHKVVDAEIRNTYEYLSSPKETVTKTSAHSVLNYVYNSSGAITKSNPTGKVKDSSVKWVAKNVKKKVIAKALKENGNRYKVIVADIKEANKRNEVKEYKQELNNDLIRYKAVNKALTTALKTAK